MTDRDTILESLRRVRRRWRLRVTLEAGVRAAILIVAALVVWYGLGRAGLSERVLGAVRVGLWIGMAGSLVALLVRALRRRADDAAIALYLEEHEPELAQAVVSAVDSMQLPAAGGSAVLVDRVLALARGGLERVELGSRVERPRLRRAAGTLATVAFGSIALVAFGPASFRASAGALFNPAARPPVPDPFTVGVEPGNATVPRGGAQAIAATLGGFESDVADLVFRTDTTAEWERIPMERDSLAGRFLSRLFDLNAPTEYYVESQGIRSGIFRLDVVDLPAVRRLQALIRYPRYTGLPAETIEDAGDLAVLGGSTVTIRAMLTRPARAASLALQNAEPVAMEARPDGSWAATFRVTTDGFYRIDLEAGDGRSVRGSLEYAIDVLEDAPPIVRFAEPGRDTKVTSVEEVLARIEAADDYGVRGVRLHVVVNGGDDQAVTVVDSTASPRKEVSAGHTFFLEEWALSPGDLVSYYAEATDGAGQVTKSDLYFFEVRPFDRNYHAAEQQGGGGGGGSESPEGLSERQRQVIVATFNVVRDSVDQNARTWRENLTTLAISQGRLREEVSSLVTRLKQRNLARLDSTFALIARELDSAAGVMQRAEVGLGRQRPRTALPDEQRALQHLQRAEAAYRDVQVSMGGGGGGGGGGNAQSAEELADLFELETDRLKNQYESVQQESSREQQAESRLDETLERLRRLASRQQQENERMERMADALRDRSSRAGGGGGGSQRDLARETEEAARQLERLARERNDPKLEQTAQDLRRAAESMRRAATSGAEQGGAQGNEALDRLKNAARELERARAQGRQDQIRSLAQRADDIRRRQAEVAEQSTSLPQDPTARRDRVAAISSRKDALAREVDELEAEASRLARDAAREQPKAARDLGAAAEGIRTNRIRDKLLYSKGLLGNGAPEYLKNLEDGISDNLAEASEQLRRAAGSLEEPAGSREAQALERARDLVRGLESLRDRARAAQNRQQGQQGEQGQQPGQQQGQEGRQQGQQGEAQGRQGQRGQQGQQGQQGQSGRQGNDQGDPNSPGGLSRGAPNSTGGGRLDPDDVRQFVRDLRSRRAVADSLRTDLRALDQDVTDLDRVLSQFRELENSTTFGDPKGLERLEQDLIEQLKNLEFALWRKFGADPGQRPALGASARVPPKYRDLVEEYYRSLARERGKTP